jgi:hypothetical protein
LNFSTTINRVENNAKYFYHYQRYKLTQEYFEKPIMPVPPLILIWYLGMIAQFIWNQLTRRCRKRTNNKQDKYQMIKIFSKFNPIRINYD